MKKLVIFILILALVAGIGIAIKKTIYHNSQKKIYEAAKVLQNDKKYEEAIKKFKELDAVFDDSDKRIKSCEAMLETDINELNKAYEKREIRTRDMADKLNKLNNQRVNELNSLMSD